MIMVFHKACRLVLILLAAPVLSGCYSTREVMVDYPLTQKVREVINGAQEASVILSDSQSVSVNNLRLDSLAVTWQGLSGIVANPLADIRSIRIIDPDEYWSQTWKGMAFGAAGFALLGATGSLSGQPVLIGEVAAAAFTGALGALLTRNLWGYFADPRVEYVIVLPSDSAGIARLRADRILLTLRTEEFSRTSNLPAGDLRLALGFGVGWGNTVNAESAPESNVGLAPIFSLGFAVSDRVELALDGRAFLQPFSRSSAGESVNRFQFLFTGKYFPVRPTAFFIEAGAGVGSYTAQGTYKGSVQPPIIVTPSQVVGDGFTFCAGVGYDLTLGEAWLIRPAFRISYTSLGDLELNDSAVIAVRTASVVGDLSLSLVFRGE